MCNTKFGKYFNEKTINSLRRHTNPTHPFGPISLWVYDTSLPNDTPRRMIFMRWAQIRRMNGDRTTEKKWSHRVTVMYNYNRQLYARTV